MLPLFDRTVAGCSGQARYLVPLKYGDLAHLMYIHADAVFERASAWAPDPLTLSPAPFCGLPTYNCLLNGASNSPSRTKNNDLIYIEKPPHLRETE